MALSDEDKKEVGELVATSVAEAMKATKEPAGGNPPADDSKKTLIQQAADAAAEDEAKKANEAKISESVKFNGRIAGVVKENLDAFGGKAGEMLMGIVETQTQGKTETEKADITRKALIDQWIQKQTNIDSLPEALKEEITIYKGMTEDAKLAQSARFFKVVDSGVEITKQAEKAKQIAIAKASGTDTKAEMPKYMATLMEKQTKKAN